ncbi:MAG: VWA domain-containing protein [Lachnospiraceae bacterium]|nr:VWA domain-containing protein [Lachnospiraceae bacterium]
MPNMRDLEKTPRRVLPIFYVLDTSGSMMGTPIATLNRAMNNTVNQVRRLADSNADALIKIAVLEVKSGCRWLQPNGPEELDDFYWQPLEADGLTDMGAALTELDSKLSQKAFLGSMTGAYLPVIIFMTDGYATDDYKTPLEKIRQNRWFSRGVKIGFAVGEDADVGMISEIAGSSEAVIQTTDLDLFARLLRNVSVTSSLVFSASRIAEDDVDGGDIVRRAKEMAGIDGADDTRGTETEYEQKAAPDPFEWEMSF